MFMSRVTLRPRPKLPEGTELSFSLYVAQTLVFKSKPEDHGKAAQRALETQRNEVTAAAAVAAAGDRQMEILKAEAIDRLKQAMIEGGENEDGFSGFEFLTAFTNRCRDQGSEWGDWGDEPLSFDLPAVPLCGDSMLEAYAHGTFGATDHLFSAWFNTAFVRNRKIVLTKFELDKALKDKKFFAPHFTVELLFTDPAATAAAATATATTPPPPPSTAAAADCPSPSLSPAGQHGAQALHERLFQPIATVGGAAEIPRTCSTPVPLNLSLMSTTATTATSKSPVEVATELLERMLRVYLRCGYFGTVLDDGIASVAHHPDFEALHRASAELDGVDMALLKTHEDKLAFWLNVRNLMALHAVAIEYSRRDPTGPICITAKEWSGITMEARYSIGHLQYTLHEVENMVLRPGLPAADNGVPGVCVAPFKEGDGRKRFVLETRDNRIPLAITQCTMSSPRVMVFHPCTVNEELDAAAELFLRTHSYVPSGPLTRNAQAFVPKYCMWFTRDFGKKREQLEFLGQLMHVPQLADYDVKYNEFDWELRVYLDHLHPRFVITHKIPVPVPVVVATTATSTSTSISASAVAPSPSDASPATTPKKHKEGGSDKKKKHHHHKDKKPAAAAEAEETAPTKEEPK